MVGESRFPFPPPYPIHGHPKHPQTAAGQKSGRAQAAPRAHACGFPGHFFFPVSEGLHACLGAIAQFHASSLDSTNERNNPHMHVHTLTGPAAAAAAAAAAARGVLVCGGDQANHFSVRALQPPLPPWYVHEHHALPTFPTQPPTPPHTTHKISRPSLTFRASSPSFSSSSSPAPTCGASGPLFSTTRRRPTGPSTGTKGYSVRPPPSCCAYVALSLGYMRTRVCLYVDAQCTHTHDPTTNENRFLLEGLADWGAEERVGGAGLHGHGGAHIVF